MSKIMTTHEFAKLLLESENKPIYIKENYEVQGEYCSGYSNIKGISDKVVEDGFIIDVDYLKASPNDKILKKGDAIVTLLEDFDNVSELNISYHNIIYMIFEKSAHYYSWHLDYISFFKNIENQDIKLLKTEIKVAINSGFHPDWKTMTFNEAKNWYLENFAEEIEFN